MPHLLLSPHRWKRTASTVCTAYSIRLPAPSTSILAVFSCGQSCPRAAMLSSLPPLSQATLASSCSEFSQMSPPTAGVWGLGLVTAYIPHAGLDFNMGLTTCPICHLRMRNNIYNAQWRMCHVGSATCSAVLRGGGRAERLEACGSGWLSLP